MKIEMKNFFKTGGKNINTLAVAKTEIWLGLVALGWLLGLGKLRNED